MTTAPVKCSSRAIELLTAATANLPDNFRQIRDPHYKIHYFLSQGAIKTAFKNLESAALIVGSGPCNDLPLSDLVRQFGRTSFVDIDSTSTNKALAALPEDLRQNSVVQEADLSGILETLTEQAEKIVSLNLSHEEFVEAILDLLPGLNKKQFPYQNQTYSFVCSSMVSSQMIGAVVQFLHSISVTNYGKPFTPSASRRAEFESFLGKIQEDHVRELHKLVAPGGKIYYADHFSAKTVYRLEADDVVWQPGQEEVFPGSKTTQEVVQKLFDDVFKEKWTWSLPLDTFKGSKEVENPDGTITIFPLKGTVYRQYEITSYVLSKKDE